MISISVQQFACENCCLFSALEKITDGFILVDENGDILMMNAAARRLLGIGQEAINGRPLNHYLVDLQIKRLWKKIADANVDAVTENRREGCCRKGVRTGKLLCFASFLATPRNSSSQRRLLRLRKHSR